MVWAETITSFLAPSAGAQQERSSGSIAHALHPKAQTPSLLPSALTENKFTFRNISKMVRACVFPGCSNKEVSWSPFRFHRVPLNGTDLTQRWLVALNITATLSRERLRQLRVCSDHFSEEDYVKPRPNKKDRHMLKSTALPKRQHRNITRDLRGWGRVLPEDAQEETTDLQLEVKRDSMVRVCVFPGCETKMKSYNPETFHRLPLRYNDRALINQWLIVLNMDIKTTTKTLMKKDYRVCSKHFEKDDFVIPTRASDPDNPKKACLKKTAIPRLHRLEPQDTCAVTDGSSGRSTGNEENVPEASSATPEKPVLQHIVDKEAILQLLDHCPMCEGKCRCMTYLRGPYIIVYQSCYFCNHQRKWASQPEARNMARYQKKTNKAKGQGVGKRQGSVVTA